MTDLTVKLSALAPGVLDETVEETVHISEDFSEDDVRDFIAHRLEGVADRLLARQDFPRPLRTVLLGNAARLNRLEELVTEFFQDHSLPSSVLDRLQELFIVDAPEAIARWGGPEIDDETADDGDEDDEG